MNMKTFAFVATLCFVAVSAAPVEQDITAALDRAQELSKSAHQLIADHEANNRGHLMSSVTFAANAMDKVVYDLKKLSTETSDQRTAELNKLEEDLLYHENRLSEELAFVEDVYKNYKASGTKDASELLQYAQYLFTQAKAAMAKHQGPNYSREEIQISSEEFQVKMLMNALSHNSFLGQAGSILEEQALVMHEKTLKRLIEQLETQ